MMLRTMGVVVVFCGLALASGALADEPTSELEPLRQEMQKLRRENDEIRAKHTALQMRLELEKLRQENAEMRAATAALEQRLQSEPLASRVDKVSALPAAPAKLLQPAALFQPAVLGQPAPLEQPPLAPLADLRPEGAMPGFCVTATGEYFSWKTRQTTTPFAGVIQQTVIGVDQFVQTVSTEDSGFGWDGGFRAGINVRTPLGWDVGFDYTRFRASGTTKLGDRANDTNGIYAALVDRDLANTAGLETNFILGQVDEATESVQLELNLFDLSMSRTFQPVANLDLRFLTGVRFAEVGQDQTVQYFNVDTLGTLDRDTLLQHLQMRGYGARFGLDASYRWGGTGFSTFGGCALSLLYADFRGQRTEIASSEFANFTETRQYTAHTSAVVPIVDLKVGLRYEWRFLTVACGYEFSQWFNMRRQPDVVGSTSGIPLVSNYRLQDGDLSFDGWFVQAGVRY